MLGELGGELSVLPLLRLCVGCPRPEQRRGGDFGLRSRGRRVRTSNAKLTLVDYGVEDLLRRWSYRCVNDAACSRHNAVPISIATWRVERLRRNWRGATQRRLGRQTDTAAEEQLIDPPERSPWRSWTTSSAPAREPTLCRQTTPRRPSRTSLGKSCAYRIVYAVNQAGQKVRAATSTIEQTSTALDKPLID